MSYVRVACFVRDEGQYLIVTALTLKGKRPFIHLCFERSRKSRDEKRFEQELRTALDRSKIQSDDVIVIDDNEGITGDNNNSNVEKAVEKSKQIDILFIDTAQYFMVLELYSYVHAIASNLYYIY